MTQVLRLMRRAPAARSFGDVAPPAARRMRFAARRPGRLLGRGRPALALSVALGLALLPARAARAQGPAEGSMVEAVVAALAQPDRRIYVAPGLEPWRSAASVGIGGRPRHTAETLERVKERFGATIAYPEEAMQCADEERPETCTIPGDGMVFYFFAPERPLRNGILPMRVVLYHNGRGTGGQILREMWDLLVRREPNVGWTVVRKRLFATADGPA